MTVRLVEPPATNPVDAAAASQRLLPCTFCGEPTPHATLASLGARCSPCYAAYCRAVTPMPHVPATAIPPNAGGRAWAYRLRFREQCGERLTQFQRDAWRSAMRFVPSTTEDTP